MALHPETEQVVAEGRAGWQVVLGVAGLVVLVVVGVLLLSGGGHGPGRHAPGSGRSTSPVETTPPAGHVPPSEGHG